MKTFYTIVCIILVTTLNLISKDNNAKDLPKMLGMTNAGREFYFSFIPCWETVGSGNELKLYITSSVSTLVTVEVPGKGYSKQQKTKPNDVIEFTLSPAIGQPYRKTDREVPEPDQVWRAAGVHVYADDPIICYGVTRYQYTSDGFLALPVETLGKDYIIASFADPSPNTIQWLPSYSAITAAYDKTKVTFTMGGTDWSKTAGGLMPGQPSTWNLNAGDVLLIAGLGSKAEITGSTVHATKPVSVVSGNFCAYIPTNCGCCDVIEEMEIPTHLWGNTYHVTPIINRLKNSIIKIFAKEAKTKVYRDYKEIGLIRNSGGTEENGYLHMRADTNGPRPVVISGDKPIGVTQFNCGQQDDNIVSDPFQMVLLPIEQYSTEAIFCTPGIKGGYGFPYNYINICYSSASDSLPDELELGQYTGSDFTWTRVKDISSANSASFSSLPGDKKYFIKTVKLPGDGVYKVRHSEPLQAYLYGFSRYDSYGMPASASMNYFIVKDTLPPVPEWQMECDGTVNLHKTRYVTDKPDDPYSRSNLSTIYMLSSVSYNYKLYYSDFMPCEDFITSWRLEPIDNSKDARAVVTFIDCAGNDTTLDITYNAVKLSVVPRTRDYGLHSIGQTTDKMYYVVNSGTASAKMFYLMLKKKDREGKPSGFSLWDSTGKNPLATEFPKGIEISPLDSFPFIVRFEALAEGEYWDSIGVGDTCNFWYKSQANADVGVPIINVSDWTASLTTIDSSSFGQFEITNLGTLPLDIYDYIGPTLMNSSNSSKIFLSEQLSNMSITPLTPLRLIPMSKHAFQIRFKPDAEKDYFDSIVFVSNTIKDPAFNNDYPIDSVCNLWGNGTTVNVEDEYTNNRIIISPNPVSDNLIIYGINQVDKIKIFDLLGSERQCSLTFSEARTLVNTSGLTEGIYIIQLTNGSENIFRKFVIKR